MDMSTINFPGANVPLTKLRWPGDDANWLEKLWFQVDLIKVATHDGTRGAALSAIERLLCE